jgi:polysaccharide biosynthesis protein PslF
LTSSFGFLSTHPPTQCGLATFNAALSAQLLPGAERGGVVRVTDDHDPRPAPGVVHTWRHGTAGGWRAAASALNEYDVAIIQHEYGIYPGPDGSDVLPLLRRLTVPSIVVLHTVLTQPSERQRRLLEQIVAAASAVITITVTARDHLLAGYAVSPAKVSVIPHGSADHRNADHRSVDHGRAGSRSEVGRTGRDVPIEPRQRPHLLTWGLLGPGKGIEWALRALARLQDLDRTPTYTIAGRTHPKVLQTHGDTYRTGLQRLGAELGIARDVDYDPVYRDEAQLGRLIRSADVVVLPYDSREQVTSGVLIEAVAAGVPIVATRFPHAVELLTDGPGLLVPHRDPVALAAAVRRILTESGLRARLVGGTHGSASTLRWSEVAARYGALADGLVAARPPALVSASR